MIQHRASQALHPTTYIRTAIGIAVLALPTLGYVFNFVDRQVMTILIEPIKAEFGATDTQMGFLSGLAFALFYATWVYRWLVLPTDGQDAMCLPSP